MDGTTPILIAHTAEPRWSVQVGTAQSRPTDKSDTLLITLCNKILVTFALQGYVCTLIKKFKGSFRSFAVTFERKVTER